MRIALLTTGRFTLVDLARELCALGHEVKVYSLVPPFRNRLFGLPEHCNRWLGARGLPLYAAVRYLPDGQLKDHANEALLELVDERAIDLLEPCDVLISMSGIGVRVLEEARRRYGARIFVERSSVHILTQRDILERMPGMDRSFGKRFRYERDLLSYALADVITVPSRHVLQSFLERGYAPERLFLNMFGVSLEQFVPTPAPARDARPTIVMAGAWSLQKGCDVLVEAWRKLPGTRLLHVGPVADLPLPDDPLFEHVDAVPQAELLRYYAQSHVFALPSRQDGMGIVLIQALASGLPIVCTTMTGGPDLANWATTPDAVRVVPPDDADALARALEEALATLPAPGKLRDLLGEQRGELSWPASARRYEQRLQAAVLAWPTQEGVVAQASS